MSTRHVVYAFVTACIVACGGAVNEDDGDAGSAGTSRGGETSAGTGGASFGGTSNGGSGAVAGAVFGGASGFGGVAGGFGAQAGQAGTGAVAGSPPYNPVCPPVLPPVRAFDVAGAAIALPCTPLNGTCTYDWSTGCLCTSNLPYECVRANPTCGVLTADTDAELPARPADPIPMNTRCTCSLSGWSCVSFY